MFRSELCFAGRQTRAMRLYLSWRPALEAEVKRPMCLGSGDVHLDGLVEECPLGSSPAVTTFSLL